MIFWRQLLPENNSFNIFFCMLILNIAGSSVTALCDFGKQDISSWQHKPTTRPPTECRTEPERTVTLWQRLRRDSRKTNRKDCRRTQDRVDEQLITLRLRLLRLLDGLCCFWILQLVDRFCSHTFVLSCSEIMMASRKPRGANRRTPSSAFWLISAVPESSPIRSSPANLGQIVLVNY